MKNKVASIIGTREDSRQWLLPLLLGAGALALYLLTIAPTVLWGDDAHFQRIAFTGELRADGSGHWLWLQAARLFIRIPWGDVAFRTNLLSAVAAAATIPLLYAAGRAAGLERGASVVAVLSLTVAHTFWMHAVRAEVYTLFTMMAALQLWLWGRWRENRVADLYHGAALFGVTLLAHQMAVLLLPAWALLIWRRRAWLNARRWFIFLGLLALGLVPFFAVITVQIAAATGASLPAALHLYFTHAGADFQPALLDYSLSTFPRDVIMWIGLLGLQFVGLSFLFGLWGLLSRLRAGLPAPWMEFLTLYFTNLVFALSYRVNDRYVFFLPGYLVFSLFVGAGWQCAKRLLIEKGKWRRSWAVIGVGLVVLVPVATYDLLPKLLSAGSLNPLDVRTLPGRDPHRFFLWPGKRGYVGAARYGGAALDTLPPGATLIADHTPLETLRYLQEVEGMRPDVRLIKSESGDDLAPFLANLPPDTPVFLADDNPDYYAWRSLPGADLVSHDPVFRLHYEPRE